MIKHCIYTRSCEINYAWITRKSYTLQLFYAHTLSR